jgi:thiol-disulfide isomerase/thioredoxin
VTSHSTGSSDREPSAESGPAVAGRRPPISTRRRLLFTGIGCLLAGLLAVGLFGPWGTSNPSVKLPATLPSLDGGPAVRLPTLGSVRSVPVVITFFASWCSPCQAELPAIARFAHSETTSGVKIGFIGVDENDTSAGRTFAARSGVDFPVGNDPDGTVLQDLGAEPDLPQTIFIDSAGNNVEHVYGSVTSGSALQTWVRRITSN